MNKKLLLLPFLVLALASCSEENCDCTSICGWSTSVQPTSQPTSSPTDPTSVVPTSGTPTSTSETTVPPGPTSTSETTTPIPPEEHVTVLCLSPIGLYKGAKGEQYGVYENCILYTEPIGSELPKAADVTSTSGATFTAWVSYENDGVPSVFTLVPNENYKVLYAQFTGGGGGGGSTTVPPGPGPVTDTWAVYFQAKSWWQADGAETYIYLWGNGGEQNEVWPGEPMNYVGNDIEGNKIYSYVVLTKYIGIKICRINPNDHSVVWNYTPDMIIADRGEGNAIWADPKDAETTSGWYKYTA